MAGQNTLRSLTLYTVGCGRALPTSSRNPSSFSGQVIRGIEAGSDGMAIEMKLTKPRNNATLLASLGLSSAPSIRPPAAQKGLTEREERIRKSTRSGSGSRSVKRKREVVEPTRRSGRVAAAALSGDHAAPDYSWVLIPLPLSTSLTPDYSHDITTHDDPQSPAS